METKTLYLIVNKDISLVGAGDFEVSIETELICDELPDPVLNNFSITVHFFCN